MFSLNAHSYAWHENLGIDANKAAELYQTKPNDPAIVQWKNALQLAINGMGKCLDVETAISCESLMSTIISNCKSHPNTLLACNDSRLPQYPLILQQAQEAQKKVEEEQEKQRQAQQKAEEEQEKLRAKANALKVPMYALSIIDKCFSNPNSNTTFEVASPACDRELRVLLQDCNIDNMTSSPYSYCNDKKLVGYLKKNGILNSTVSP